VSDAKPAGKNSKRVLGPAELQPYYDLMVAQDLTELEIREKDFFVRLSRQSAGAAPVYYSAPPAAPAAPAALPEPPPEQNQFHSVASPLAGVFYRSPSPTSEPFVKAGDKVAHNQVLCIIEAMKVMNEIRADRPSVVRKILVENGKPVTAGQNLFLVDPVA
jgi:acetyl-CoA carboxylase biotin carboxyl carrier protein